MAKRVIIISGSVGSGKSTLAQGLCGDFGFVHFKTNVPLKEKYTKRTKTDNYTRKDLQKFGDELDRKTKGQWVCTALDDLMRKNRSAEAFVVDSVRIENQIVHIRKAYGSEVVHVHLSAPQAELGARYKRRRRSDVKEFAQYKDVLKNRTEREVDKLLEKADIFIDTAKCTPGDVVVRVAARLGLYGKSSTKNVDVLVGGQYGSEGKGNITAYLAPEYDVLVRVGGPNAGHKVFQEPEPETFHMLPSGTRRAPKARLVIGAGAVFRVSSLLSEIGRCDVESDRLAIDPQAMIIADEDIEKEKELVAKIGSTGQGVGAATARRILNRFPNATRLAGDISELRPYIREAWKILRDANRKGQRILLEGTQGTGLSLFHGSYPHVTSRDTTVVKGG